VRRQALLPIAIWLATIACLVMLFAPLVRDLVERLRAAALAIGPQ
jgi:hypothetical protein